MTKKLRIVVMLFILAFSFSVKATVLLEVNCDGNDIAENKSIVCEGTLLYEREGINDIEFNYQTNLNVEFLNVDGFTINNSNGKVMIHTDKALYGKIMTATPIVKFMLSTNDKVSEKEKFIINNIMINKNSNIVVDGSSLEFNVTTPIKQDNICTLDSITIEKEPLKGFNKDTFEYKEINITSEVVFIDAVRTSAKSSATGLGDVRVPNGETVERKIIVTAEDGSIKVYKLYITNITPKEDNINVSLADIAVKSSDNTLKLLELYNGKKKIDIDFKNDTEIYNIDINEEVTKLTIKATLNDNKASFVEKYGPRDIKINYGYNKELIKILSENGSERIITLNINYQDNRVKDNSLLSLKINNEIVDLTSDKLEIRLPYNNTKTIIEAIPNSDKAIVKYDDSILQLGSNMVTITVTSESGDTRVYNINVIREEKIVLLDSITIVGYNINFKKYQNNYDLELPNNVNDLKIVVNPSDIQYEVLYNNNLQDGSKVLIKIIDDDGIHEYIINIIKTEILSNSVCYGVFVFGLMSMATSIYTIKKKNKT